MEAAVALAVAAVLLWPDRSAPVHPGRPGALRLLPRARRAARATEADPVEVLGLLALALRGGAAVTPALGAVARVVGGDRGVDLRTVATALAWGVDENEAWAAVPPSWAPARRALTLAGRAGVPPADLIDAAARDAHGDRIAEAELVASRLGVRLVLPVGLLLLPAFVLTTVVPVVLALATEVLPGGS